MDIITHFEATVTAQDSTVLLSGTVDKTIKGEYDLLKTELVDGTITNNTHWTANKRSLPIEGLFALDEIFDNVTFVPDVPEVGDISFPDGVVGHSYRFTIEPNSGTPPYQFSLISGSLPDGLTLNGESGLIQGTPSERGSAQLTVQVTDATGDVVEIKGVLNVFGVLTVGTHASFKGCNGLQMAFNASQNLDEIRIEQGTYRCHGLEIPEGKDWEHGIKISGGWDSRFENQSDDPALTVFDGGGEGGILTVSSGVVTIEWLSFQNGDSTYGGAISADVAVNITNSSFTSNNGGHGGAVYGSNNIINSIFTNNTGGHGGAVSDSNNIINSIFTSNTGGHGGAVNDSNNIINSIFTSNTGSHGGAVSDSNNIINSIFTNNTGGHGGAVNDSNNIINSIFTNNDATYGGAVNDSNNIINSIFTNNSASHSGGAFYGKGTILNSIFAQNKARDEANDITQNGKLHVDYTLVNSISEGVDLGTHFIMGDPHFVDAPNGDFRLRADSPAINVGDSSVIESYPFLKDEAGNEIDLDGNRRIVGEAIDLGAYEHQ